MWQYCSDIPPNFRYISPDLNGVIYHKTATVLKYTVLVNILQWRYSPGWALASFTIRLQASRSRALSLHSFIPIFLRSVDTSSSHLIFGLPLRLVAYSFPYNIFFWIAMSCILSIWPSHLILWHLINLTMFSPLIMVSNSSFRRIRHNSFSFTGPYIFRKIFLSNTANALSVVFVYDIFVNCNWVVTRWQKYSTHLHTNNT